MKEDEIQLQQHDIQIEPDESQTDEQSQDDDTHVVCSSDESDEAQLIETSQSIYPVVSVCNLFKIPKIG